jgi:hypothetical protein
MLVWALAKNPWRPFYESLGGVLLPDKKKVTTIGGAILDEVAYGWKGIGELITRLP